MSLSTSTPRIKITVPREPSSSLSSSSSPKESPPLVRRPAEDTDDDEEEHEFDDDHDSLSARGGNGMNRMTPPKQSPQSTSTSATTTTTAATSSLWGGLRNKNLNFPINTECTSLCLSPSGHFVWAGFSDGTLRVFDLSGRFDLGQETWKSSRQKSSLLVPSTSHQRYGAVACQIHARGVHTDLLMHVTTCVGDYVFGGVPRGAMEVYAVHIQELEDHVLNRRSTTMTTTSTSATAVTKNILDYIQVHVHADAKLKGLGACTQLQNVSRPTYLLLTGKGIKNIHIWKFQPPYPITTSTTTTTKTIQEPAVWEQLYDTPTNGNTIHLLSFYRNPEGILWGISQSDTQKVRLWDLSIEEQPQKEQAPLLHINHNRPKRPPYQDVTNSQAALGIAGGYGVCGGPTMYNQLSIVSLDNPKSIYNHTELALPVGGDQLPSSHQASSSLSSCWGGSSSGGGRQRRGDLKQVVNVATLPNDSNHALLELDDGSIVHYTSNKLGRPKLEILSEEKTGIRDLPADYWCRTLCLGNPGGLVVVAALAYYNPQTQQGHIQVRALQPLPMLSTFSSLSSSPVADSHALSRLCMEAPPASAVKLQKKKAKKKQKEQQQVQFLPNDDLSAEKRKASTLLETPTRTMTTGKAIITTIPMSMDHGSVSKIKKKKRKSTSISHSNPFPIPASVEKKTLTQPERSTKHIETPLSEHIHVSFDSRERIPLTVPTAPQVSPPSTTTPAAGANKSAAVPSSEESRTVDHGAMAKFLIPKRVLHNYSELHQPPRASPSVPRKILKQKVSSVNVRKPMDSERHCSPPSQKPESESFEIKVRTTLPIQSATVVAKRKSEPLPEMLESKRPRSVPTTVPNSVENVAHWLVDLKSPVSEKSKGASTDCDVGVRGTMELLQKLLSYRETLLHPHKSRLLTDTVDVFGSFPSQSRQERILTEHRAAQERIQKRLLQAAESTLRLLVIKRMTPEAARSELKGIIRSFEEVLHDTLTRQELELEALVGTYGKTPLLTMAYQGAFDVVTEIYSAIDPGKRPPGRPKGTTTSA